MLDILENMKDFIYGFVICFYLYTIFFFGFVYEPKQQNKNLISKQNIDIKIKDTLQNDNANITIIVVDSIEYLVYRYGSKIEIVKHK